MRKPSVSRSDVVIYACRAGAVTSLTAVAGLHVMWASGSTWPLHDATRFRLAVGGSSRPRGTGMTLVVAALLGAAALLVGGRPRGPARLRRAGVAVTSAVLLARGALGVSGRTPVATSSPTFRHLDRYAYGPFCLVLGGLCLAGLIPPGILKGARHDRTR